MQKDEPTSLPLKIIFFIIFYGLTFCIVYFQGNGIDSFKLQHWVGLVGAGVVLLYLTATAKTSHISDMRVEKNHITLIRKNKPEQIIAKGSIRDIHMHVSTKPIFESYTEVWIVLVDGTSYHFVIPPKNVELVKIINDGLRNNDYPLIDSATLSTIELKKWMGPYTLYTILGVALLIGLIIAGVYLFHR